MSHSFSVSKAVFDGTRFVSNPKINLVGTVDGQEYVFSITWHGVFSAYNDEGGVASLRAVLAPIMLDTMFQNQRIPIEQHREVPVFHGSVPSPPTADANAGWITVPEVLNAGSWTAD